MINEKDLNPKVGETLYLGEKKGVVVELMPYQRYPIVVEFECGQIRTFTSKGYEYLDESGLPQFPLSHTPYKVKIKGYSNTRPLPKLDKDKVVYVRDGDAHPWSMRFPSHFNKRGVLECFVSQKKEGCTITWDQYSFTNPLEK